MPEKREWPNDMAHFRNEAAHLAWHGLYVTDPIVTRGGLDQVDILARINKAREALYRIEIMMIAAGARIDPIKEEENESPLLVQGTGRRITDKLSLPHSTSTRRG